MADHFEVMAGRLLTESTLQSAIDEASAAPSSTTTALAVQDGRPKRGVMVECRICQVDDDEACMEAPCSCKGSLKQFAPNYTASSKLFQHGRNTIFFSAPGYIQLQPMLNADQTSTTSASYDNILKHPTPADGSLGPPRRPLLLSVLLGDQGTYTIAMLTLLMLRTAGIAIPVYIILVLVAVSEPAGAERTQPQQHVIG
uniref:RING-CH-type domain-containing protein n=1 Tax=Setaria viridis TaxID=4556 RepID=A0A4U6UUI2_SETVI|nr:hypothetical protein SEVIR_4G000200v2 [Setaria viridis]